MPTTPRAAATSAGHLLALIRQRGGLSRQQLLAELEEASAALPPPRGRPVAGPVTTAFFGGDGEAGDAGDGPGGDAGDDRGGDEGTDAPANRFD